MRTVLQYIQTLLFEHDYVTVPNLGAFIANYQSASFNEISGSLMPPQKRIAFNEVLRQDDGLLAMHIARRENISIEEAKKRIQNFVSEVKGRLFLDRFFGLDKIGTFSLNGENNLVFEPDRKANYYSESFGFDSLYPRRSEKEISVYNTQVILEEASDDFEPSSFIANRKPNSSFHFKNVAMYVLPIFALTIGLFYIVLNPKTPNAWDKNRPSLSSVNPLDYLPKESNATAPIEEVKSPKVEENVEVAIPKNEIIRPVLKSSKTVVKNEEVAKNTVVKANAIVETPKIIAPKIENVTLSTNSSPTATGVKRYKIIAGLFKNSNNAERQKMKLIAGGFDKVQLVAKSSFIEIIAAETDNKEEARKIAQKISTIIGEKALIQ